MSSSHFDDRGTGTPTHTPAGRGRPPRGYGHLASDEGGHGESKRGGRGMLDEALAASEHTGGRHRSSFSTSHSNGHHSNGTHSNGRRYQRLDHPTDVKCRWLANCYRNASGYPSCPGTNISYLFSGPDNQKFKLPRGKAEFVVITAPKKWDYYFTTKRWVNYIHPLVPTMLFGFSLMLPFLVSSRMHEGGLEAHGYYPRLAHACRNVVADHFDTLTGFIIATGMIDCFLIAANKALDLWAKPTARDWRHLTASAAMKEVDEDQLRHAAQSEDSYDPEGNATLALTATGQPTTYRANKKTKSQLRNRTANMITIVLCIGAFFTLLGLAIKNAEDSQHFLNDDAVSDQKMYTQLDLLIRLMVFVTTSLSIYSSFTARFSALREWHVRPTQFTLTHTSTFETAGESGNLSTKIKLQEKSASQHVPINWLRWRIPFILTLPSIALPAAIWACYGSADHAKHTEDDDTVQSANIDWDKMGDTYNPNIYLIAALYTYTGLRAVFSSYIESDANAKQALTTTFPAAESNAPDHALVPIGNTALNIHAPGLVRARMVSAGLTTTLGIFLGVLANWMYTQAYEDAGKVCLGEGCGFTTNFAKDLAVGQYGWELMLIPLVLFTTAYLLQAHVMYMVRANNEIDREESGIYFTSEEIIDDKHAVFEKVNELQKQFDTLQRKETDVAYSNELTELAVIVGQLETLRKLGTTQQAAEVIALTQAAHEALQPLLDPAKALYELRGNQLLVERLVDHLAKLAGIEPLEDLSKINEVQDWLDDVISALASTFQETAAGQNDGAAELAEAYKTAFEPLAQAVTALEVVPAAEHNDATLKKLSEQLRGTQGDPSSGIRGAIGEILENHLVVRTGALANYHMTMACNVIKERLAESGFAHAVPAGRIKLDAVNEQAEGHYRSWIKAITTEIANKRSTIPSLEAQQRAVPRDVEDLITRINPTVLAILHETVDGLPENLKQVLFHLTHRNTSELQRMLNDPTIDWADELAIIDADDNADEATKRATRKTSELNLRTQQAILARAMILATEMGNLRSEVSTEMQQLLTPVFAIFNRSEDQGLPATFTPHTILEWMAGHSDSINRLDTFGTSGQDSRHFGNVLAKIRPILEQPSAAQALGRHGTFSSSPAEKTVHVRTSNGTLTGGGPATASRPAPPPRATHPAAR